MVLMQPNSVKELLSKHIQVIGVAARLVTAACITGFLYYGSVVFIPLALALLIAFALNPSVRKLMSWRFPRALSVAVVVTSFVVFLGGLSWFIGGQLSGFAKDLPLYRNNIIEKVREFRGMFSGGTLDKLRATVKDVSAQTDTSSKVPESAPAPASETSIEDWMSSAGAVTDPAITFGLVILLVAMMLLQWADLRSRIFGFLPGNVSHTTQALADAGNRVGKYLFLQFVYNSSFGLVIGLSLWALGVPYSALWGLCAALFRYIPYVGPLFAGLLPIMVSLVTSSGWTQVASVTVLFLVLEIISNNFVEPWLYGTKLGISEIGIVMASVAWASIWGPIGLLLATPLTVCLVVLGTHVPCLSFFATLLGTENAFSDSQQIYQRLLAGDSVEAAELTNKHVRKRGVSEFTTEVLFPALNLARRDQLLRWLSPEGAEHLFEEVKVITDEIQSLDETSGAIAVENKELPAGSIIYWSGCPFTDSALPLLEREMQAPRGTLKFIRSTDLVGGVLQSLGENPEKAVAVTLAHLCEVDTPRVAGMVKRVSRSLPGIPIQVARYGAKPFTPEEKAMLTEAGASALASTPAEARIWIAAYAGMAKPAES